MNRTPDTTITIGDHVRSYDFPGREDCYVEGVVQAVGFHSEVGYRSYKIAVSRRVLENKEVRNCFERSPVYPPVNGSEGFFGPTNGVVRV